MSLITSYKEKQISLPDGFVYLHTIDPSIEVSLRYLGNDNFVGCPIEGYSAPVVILTKDAAQALKKAQACFLKDGYSLIVYDAYRPQTAVNHFKRWSEAFQDQKMKDWFYPRLDKSKAFELGYISHRSGHTRGSTLDISLIPLDKALHPIIPTPRKLRDGFEILFLDDGTIDMGSSFDLFDQASHYENELIADEHKKWRLYLKETMESCGFKSYVKEWWHFTLKDEPFSDTYFDFPIA